MTVVNEQSARPRRALLLSGIVFAVLIAIFVLLAAITSDRSPALTDAARDAYQIELAEALPGADVSIGRDLVQTQDCAACHLVGDGSVSPLFDGIAAAAGKRRPPLSAEQYLYEAILFPAAHLVDGYTNAMPNNYGDRLSRQQVAHIIAYLLTLDGTDENE